MATSGSFNIERSSNYYYTFSWSIQSTTSNTTTVYWNIKPHTNDTWAMLWYLNIGISVTTGTLTSFSTNDKAIGTSYNGGNADYDSSPVSVYANEASNTISGGTTATLYKAGTEGRWTSNGSKRGPRKDCDVVNGTFTITHSGGKASFTISGAMNLINTTPTYSKSSAFSLPDLGGTVKVWNGSSWVDAVPYVWNGSNWVIAVPYVWNGSQWKMTTG